MRECDSARRFTVCVDDEEWTETRSLSEAAPDVNVFVVDRSTGRVMFGDGSQGRRPSDDAVVTVFYREGGGATRNSYVSITTRWPPRDGRYLVELSSGGVRINELAATSSQ